MSTNDFISDITANLTDWGISYRETTEGISVGSIHLEVFEEGYRPTSTILDGTETVAITNDADKASALLAFPLARRAWVLGYAGDFEITYIGEEVEMRLTNGSVDITISSGIDEADRFTVTEHSLLRHSVVMSDLDAVITSAGLAYGDALEAWQALCLASDFDADHWESIVEFFNEDARFIQGASFTKVESCYSGKIAMVEDWDTESSVQVIDVETAEGATYWAPSDVAAAVMYIIA